MITIKRRADMCKTEFAMLTSAMRRRLLIAVAALSFSSFFAAEGFEMADFHAAVRSKLNTSAPGG